MKPGTRSKHTGLSNMSNKSEYVAEYYDNWAGDYDETLADWRYEAPEKIASMLLSKMSSKSSILDIGCGTGLSGKALKTAGFDKIDGVDVSSRSLEIAGMTGVYRSLQETDLHQLPLPIQDNHYDGLACVGVLTYLPDSIGILREFSRIVRPGGVVAMTQRSDVFVEREFQSVLDTLADEGEIAEVRISKPCPYLPDHEEFGDRILVHYIDYSIL